MNFNVYLYVSLSFLVTLALFAPFIDLLYKLKFYRKGEGGIRKDFFGKTAKVFESLKNHKKKINTPIGGGILVFLATIFLFYIIVTFTNLNLQQGTNALVFGTTLFFVIGFYDDLKKFFDFKNKVFGLRARYKLMLQFASAIPVSLFFIQQTNLLITIVLVLFYSVLIVYFANCFNITDGLDGLSMGTFLTSLIFIFIVSINKGVADITILTALLIGASLSYLYFNINPARLMLGDAGALSFGAFIAIFAIMTNTIYLLPLFAIVFLIDGTSSLLQISHKLIFKRKLFLIAPFHHLLEAKGWEETKIVNRLWLLNLVGVIFALTIYTHLT